MVDEFELVLVRHGETDSNRTKTIQGHLDTPLSSVGVEQSKLVGSHLADMKFHLAISSDLQRALKTGEAIVEANESISSIESWEVARERNFGKFQGQSAEQLMGAVKGKSREKILEWGPPGGETGQEFRGRIKQFFSQLCQKVLSLEGGERPVVLVTTHGGFIKEFNMMLVDDHDVTMPGKPGAYGKICPNTGVSRYLISLNGKGEMEKVSCTQLHFKGHLGSKEDSEMVLYGV